MGDKSKDYNSGYGQACADILSLIKEARDFVIGNKPNVLKGEATEELLLEFKQKEQALLWVRSMVKAMKAKQGK